MPHASTAAGQCEQGRASEIEFVPRCDLCEGMTFEPELVWRHWALVRCSRCNLVFTSPRYNEAYLSRLYKDHYYEQDAAYLSLQSAVPSEDEVLFARSLLEQCGMTGTVRRLRYLEVGCGAGHMVSAFQKAGCRATGLDLSGAAVRAGLVRGLDLRVAELRDFAGKSFDLIAAFHLLEHLPSPKLFLHQCAAGLATRGWLFLEVPDYGSWRARIMRSDWPHLYPDTHLFQFTLGSLRKYLGDTGFQVKKVRRVGGRGPLEHFGGDADAGGSLGATRLFPSMPELRQRIFDMRRFIWWSPSARKVARFLFWHGLGFGEYLQVLARKTA
jgi:SAM-dependent methyltransferase